MMPIKRWTLMLSAVTGAVVMLSATPASAASAPRITGLHGGRTAPLVFPNSTLAGYIASGSTETNASATFVIPTFTCTDVQNFNITVQLEGSGTAPAFAVSFVEVNCGGAGTTPSFDTLTCAGLTNSGGTCSRKSVAVTSGDRIHMSMTVTSTASMAKLKDLTTGKGQSVTGAGDATTSNANFIVQRGDATIPRFTKVVFSGATIDGQPITSYSDTAYWMTDASSVVQVAPGQFSSNGESFPTKFKNNN